MFRAFAILLIILNTSVAILGCASKQSIILAPIEQREYTIEFESGAVYSLSLECSKAMCQYVVFDALAIPQASYDFNGSRLVQNRFLLPNRRFEDLFLYIVANYSSLPNSFSFEVDGMVASIKRVLEH